jgi:hypothetical protein
VTKVSAEKQPVDTDTATNHLNYVEKNKLLRCLKIKKNIPLLLLNKRGSLVLFVVVLLSASSKGIGELLASTLKITISIVQQSKNILFAETIYSIKS